jgi:hypothetical protein
MIDELTDRTPSGRFVRNLALSLSGGALLTLLGAGVAHANEAGTASDGAGATGTGDATAVGNHSGTQANQGTGASTGGSNLQVINQNAGVANVGVAVANTGGNIAVGNASVNNATANQVSSGGPTGLAVNNGNAGNSSNGSALINTGDAYAIGNESSTTIDQRADGSAQGALGGVLVLTQNAGVLNAGIARANTGGNIAVGNASGRARQGNGAVLNQIAATAGTTGGGATNSGEATNTSDGKATISTGNASAMGNRSSTTVSQAAGSGDGDGDGMGLSIITQAGGALNAGAALANTGGNRAAGNLSNSTAIVNPQTAQITGFGGVGFANNSGSATNTSDGTAWIVTGDATATGNESRTAIMQDADAEFGDMGVNIQTQFAPVINVGTARANTGGNRALGNGSANTTTVTQTAVEATVLPLLGVNGLGIANNSAEGANSSNGTAGIHTGDAVARGNRSSTDVTQQTEADGSGLAVQTQAEVVVNAGAGFANTGRNRARGNLSENRSQVGPQGVTMSSIGSAVGVQTANNSASSFNDSDGSATIFTGDASATGNESNTSLHQAIDPTGVAVQTQAAGVVNAGLGVANSGVNGAVGNSSDNAGGNGATLTQQATLSPNLMTAGVATASNQGEAGNSSDGTASIVTGNARGVGNHSTTDLDQRATASVDGLGAAVNTQVGVVANVGVGVANTGVNGALGNDSDNRAEGTQTSVVVPVALTAGVATASNAGSVTNATDGTAVITTGDASATGNTSDTDFRQSADASVPGLGIVVNTQAGGVVNAGAGIANSGVNGAAGNLSDSEAFLSQSNTVSPVALTTIAATTSNAGEASNASTGTGEIHTGAATATGNTSATRFSQEMDGTVDGMGAVVNTQLGGVANLGLGVANSGINGAVGNASNNDAGDSLADGLVQANTLTGGPVTVGAPVTVSNAGRSANTSDGWGYVHTGDAWASGNVSETDFQQRMTGTIGEDGMGVVPNVQAAGVLNLGVGVANSGVNLAVGNASGTPLPFPPLVAPFGNDASLTQTSVLSGGVIAGDLTPGGPVTMANSAEVGSSSNGTGKVFTGNATARGNVSASTLHQNLEGNVDGMGLVVGPQVGAIANVGVGVANTGINAAAGNLSNSVATTTQTNTAVNALGFVGDGPITVGSVGGQATNASDGEACVCTGNATATGNESTSTLSQDLVIGVDDGLSVVPMTGVILNAGFGLANSGVNAAIGNISQNDATATQSATYAAGPAEFVGPQTIVTGGGSSNSSDGTGKVGTGNAKAAGNISDSELAQAATVDGAGAFASIDGDISNRGAGVANAGVNLGVGNASRNTATLTQAATGRGTVSSMGMASNSSDGFGGVGDPNCEIPGETPVTPGVPSLPKTGGPLEVEAAIGLMLLLAGFGFRRVSRAAAKRA